MSINKLILALVFFTIASSQVAMASLVGEYRADGNAQDSSGNGNHGTLMNGATFTSGNVGQAFSFNGVNQFVQVADSSSLDVTDALTIEAWIKVNAYQYQFIVGKLGGPTYERSYSLFLDQVGTLYFGTISPPGTGGTWVVGPVIPLNQWVHVAAVKDSGSTSARTYVNGALVASGNVGHPIYNGAEPFLIGACCVLQTWMPPSPRNFFSGLIDEVRIYNHALSASEIQANYNALTATPTPTTPAPTTPAPTTPAPTTPAPTTPAPTTPAPTTPAPTTPAPTTSVPTTLVTAAPTPIVIVITAAPTQPPATTQAPAATPVQAKFRVPPTVRLRPVTDVIETDQDGIIELYMDNPSLNDVVLKVDARVSVPSGFHVSGQGFALAGGAGTAYGIFEVPPGTARTIAVIIKADKNARIGSHTLQFSGLYYPGENKDNYQPLSLTYSVTVKAPSNVIPTPQPTTIIQTPVPTTPGFGILLAVISIFVIARLRLKK